MNRLANPIISLETPDDLTAFLDSTKQPEHDKGKNDFFMEPQLSLKNYSQMRLLTRVICFIYDMDDYDEEIEQLKSAARQLAFR